MADFIGGNGNDVLVGGSDNDTLTGGAGADTMSGGRGVDTFNIDADADVVTDLGLGGADVLNISTGASVTATLAAAWVATTSTINNGTASIFLNNFNIDLSSVTGSQGWTVSNSGNATGVRIRGSLHNDVLIGGTGRDTFDGNPGNNSITGGGGYDLLSYSNGSQGTAGVSVNLITGSATNTYGGFDTLTGIRELQGSIQNDILIGTNILSRDAGLSGYPSNGTTFYGSLGSDQMNGTLVTGSNNVFYNSSLFNNSTITVNFQDHDSATVIKSIGGTDVLENVQGVHGTTGNDILNGSPTTGPSGTFYNSINLSGRQGNDSINGFGLTINRVDYSSATGAVTVDLAAGTATDGLGGVDTLLNVVRVRGSNYNDRLIGSDRNDILETPALGSHFLDGGGGINEYRFSNNNWAVPDSVTIDLGTTLANGGGYQGFVTKPNGVTDTLLRFNRARGSDGNDTIYGTPVDDRLNGLAGNNILDGRGGVNTLEYGATFAGGAPTQGVSVNLAAGRATNQWGGTDLISNFQSIIGTPFADQLIGSSANETFDGYGGIDIMAGANGNDIYVTDGNDTITENANEGVDTVQSSVTYTLGTNLENLTLTGSAAINGTGNTLNNTLIGNTGNNILNGGTGSDTMRGGAGNDTYVTDGGDVITENANEGIDTVQSSVTYTLGTDLENLTLTGSARINGTGNTLSNSLIGNSANNVLSGGGGADTMSGGNGNDTYVTDGSDTILENMGEGTDLVRSSVTYTLGANLENLMLTGVISINGTGNTQANVLTGNSGNNTLSGLGGNDRLYGGDGADTLIGGLGRDLLYGGIDFEVDIFRFASVFDSLAYKYDTIYDFEGGVDKLDLSGIDANSLTLSDQQFQFSEVSEAANSVWIEETLTDVFVYADYNGDGIADFGVLVVGVSEISADDIML
jgi:Ca2+-binding RTX toxin-like protein